MKLEDLIPVLTVMGGKITYSEPEFAVYAGSAVYAVLAEFSVYAEFAKLADPNPSVMWRVSPGTGCVLVRGGGRMRVW